MSTTATLTLVQELKGHKDRVWHLAWSPTGNLLASCSGDKTVRLWKQNSESKFICQDILDGQHSRTIRCCEFDHTGKVLACASFDGSTSIWQLQEEEEEGLVTMAFTCITTLQGHENEVKSVAWDCSDQWLATCGRDKTVWIWESIDNAQEFECLSLLQGHTQDVKSVVWHPSRPMLISASYDDTIRVWVEDMDDWTCADILRGHTGTVWSVTMDKNGNYMASVGDDATLIIWKLHDKNNTEGYNVPDDKPFEWQQVQKITGVHKRTIYSVAWNATTNMIATAGGDDTLRIFAKNAQNQFALHTSISKAHLTDLNCVRWHPTNANVLATASDDGAIKIWNMQ